MIKVGEVGGLLEAVRCGLAESVLVKFPLGNSQGEEVGDTLLSAGKLIRHDFQFNGWIIT